MDKKAQKTFYNSLIRVLNSKWFFYGVLIIASLQGIWYALSFSPTIFDESKHLGRIEVYSHYLTPFISYQNPLWDHLGAIPRDAYGFFYYIMSWPWRLAGVFTDSQTIQTIFLRFISIGMFVGGLIVYRNALLLIKGSNRAIANLVFLLLVLTPSVALMPGVVNYDNMVFLIFSFILLYAIREVQSPSANFLNISRIIILGLFASIVKWTAIALFIPLLIFILYDVFKKHRNGAVKELVKSARTTSKGSVILIVTLFLLVMALFVERPVTNAIKYGKAEPACHKIISKDRCLKFPDYSIYEKVRERKPAGFSPVSHAEYLLTFWAPRMINSQVSILPREAVRIKMQLPVLSEAYFALVLISLALLLFYASDFLKSRPQQLLLFIAVFYSLVLFIFLHGSYTKNGVPAAINGRYLLPVLPILMYFSALAYNKLLTGHNNLKLLALFLIMLVFTQGGGIITHSLTAQDRLYWQSSEAKNMNQSLRNALQPLVKE